MNTSKLSGNAKLSKYGKKLVVKSMYDKGCNFIAAAILLRKNNGYEYVVLHNLCQGIEIILKSLLLHKNYDEYIDKIKSKIRHDILKAIRFVCNEYQITNVNEMCMSEISQLNEFYKNHHLRYGSSVDVLIDPKSIESDYTIGKIYQILKIVKRYINWS